MGNPVFYFEVGARDQEPLERFYGELFGWKFQQMPQGRYILVDTAAGSGVNGGIGWSVQGWPWASFYVQADDLQDVLDRAERLGGKTVVPVSEVPGVVTWAMFNDPDGLLVGLMKPAGQGIFSGPSEGRGCPVDWFEVLGSDATASVKFYTELFGWMVTQEMPNYSLIDAGAGGIGGGIGMSSDGSKWATVYANVEDVEKSLARAEELGGVRESGPIDVDDHMQTGALRDPVGNLFGVYHHAPH